MTTFEMHIQSLVNLFGSEALRREWKAILARGDRSEEVVFNGKMEDLKRDGQNSIS
jgi:hypothetical protein